MIGLDTNILVRLLTDDDPVQAGAAQRLLETEASAQSPAFVDRVALVELVWVLQRRYGYGRDAVADAVVALLRSPVLRLEDPARVIDAVRIYRDSTADFADVMLVLGARAAGCEALATFDRGAARLDGALLLEAGGS
ncbi:MAG TPA: type II toxin-antitoxin system VapC family toxin [Geminicoccus sp.]|nr:type II toxin-antitoxin system VapC family toxin [Geminicoccus sp.]